MRELLTVSYLATIYYLSPSLSLYRYDVHTFEAGHTYACARWESTFVCCVLNGFVHVD